MKEIIFSKHARERMNQRFIRRKQVLLSVSEPDLVAFRGDRKDFYKKFGRLYIKVVAHETAHKIIIVTAHFIEKIR